MNPSPPTNVMATALGARVIRVEWTFTDQGVFTPEADGFFIRVTSISEGSANTDRTITVNDRDARSFDVLEILPYRYDSVSGVRFNVSVRTFRNDPLRQSNPIAASQSPITLPRKTTAIKWCLVGESCQSLLFSSYTDNWGV